MKKVAFLLVVLIVMMPVVVLAATSAETASQLSDTELGIIIGSIVVVCVGLIVLSGKTKTDTKEAKKSNKEKKSEE